MIEECIKVADTWRNYFNNFDICIDFNNIDKNKYKNFYDFDHFYDSKCNSDKVILCC